MFCPDLDSLASSVGFAWFLSHIPTTDTKAIALITTLRADFVLRAENLYALQSVGIKEDFKELLCPEDLPNSHLSMNFALVDHNSLHPTNAVPGAQVTAIVDHHEDEGKYLDTASPRIIESAGSCASLVTRVIMSYPTLQIPPELAALLLSAIMIDTHGLRRGGKAVGVDYEASAWLLPRANGPSLGNLVSQTVETPQHVPDHPWIQSLSHALSAEKSLLSHLNTRDLLRRDYKEYIFNLSSTICGNGPRSIGGGGLATVPLPLSSFFSPSPTSAVVATQEWIKERGLSVLGVLTHYKSKQGKPKRVLMWVVDENVCGPRLFSMDSRRARFYRSRGPISNAMVSIVRWEGAKTKETRSSGGALTKRNQSVNRLRHRHSAWASPHGFTGRKMHQPLASRLLRS